jgi:hypothetical protein
MGSRSTPAPNADARRATSRRRPPRRRRLANASSPGSAAMPGSIWRRIGLRVLATGSDCVCTLAGRLDDALPAYRGHHRQGSAPTDRALRQASVAERPVALPPVHPTKGATMASLLFTCPQTHQKAPTGVETDPSRILEGNAEGRLPVLRGGARDLRARSVHRQRYSCRNRSAGPCLARMGPSDFGENGRREGTFPFGPSLSQQTKGEDKS